MPTRELSHTNISMKCKRRRQQNTLKNGNDYTPFYFIMIIIIIFFVNIGLKRHSVTNTDKKKKGKQFFFLSFFLPIFFFSCYPSDATTRSTLASYPVYMDRRLLRVRRVVRCVSVRARNCASSMRAPGEERRLRQQRREPTIQPAGRSPAAAQSPVHPSHPSAPAVADTVHAQRALARSLSRNARTHQTDKRRHAHAAAPRYSCADPPPLRFPPADDHALPAYPSRTAARLRRRRPPSSLSSSR